MNNGPEQFEPDKDTQGELPAFPELEAALRDALRPVDPPDQFAHRVYARAILQESRGESRTRPVRKGRLLSWPRMNYAVGGALAASLVVGAFVAESVHQRHERERAEAAEQQLATAIRATNHAMEVTRAQLAKSGLQLN